RVVRAVGIVRVVRAVGLVGMARIGRRRNCAEAAKVNVGSPQRLILYLRSRDGAVFQLFRPDAVLRQLGCSVGSPTEGDEYCDCRHDVGVAQSRAHISILRLPDMDEEPRPYACWKARSMGKLGLLAGRPTFVPRACGQGSTLPSPRPPS